MCLKFPVFEAGFAYEFYAHKNLYILEFIFTGEYSFSSENEQLNVHFLLLVFNVCVVANTDF